MATAARHRALELELLQTFLELDWHEFRNVGPSSVTKHVPESQRSMFAASFQALCRDGCREDVLFPCVFIFVNSEIVSAVDFPWVKRFEPIKTGIKKIRQTVEEISQFPGFRRLEAKVSEPWLFAFPAFESAQRKLLASALLGCFMPLYEERNWTRDLSEFQNKYPEFSELVAQHLDNEHKSLNSKLPPLDWKKFEATGQI